MQIVDILKWFCKNYSHYVKQMQESDHNLSLEDLNPHHAEGTVWTHLMCTLVKLRDSLNNTNYSFNQNAEIEMILALLLHDIGKPFCRKLIKDEIQNITKVVFYNHEQYSTYLAIDILNKFEQDFPNVKLRKERILMLINWHTVFHKMRDSIIDLGVNNIDITQTKKDEFNAQFNISQFDDSDEFWFQMITVTEADTYGRLAYVDYNKEEAKYNFLKSYMSYRETNKTNRYNLPELIIPIGIPGCGKTTLINQLLKTKEYEVLGTDKLLMERYPTLLYSEAYMKAETQTSKQYNNENVFYELEMQMFNELETLTKKRRNIIIDRTNCTKSARDRIFGHIKGKYYKTAYVFLVGESTIINQNKMREKEGKNLQDYIINTKAKELFIPSYVNFDRIEFIVR